MISSDLFRYIPYIYPLTADRKRLNLGVFCIFEFLGGGSRGQLAVSICFSRKGSEPGEL
jgi:hypothetical protein